MPKTAASADLWITALAMAGLLGLPLAFIAWTLTDPGCGCAFDDDSFCELGRAGAAVARGIGVVALAIAGASTAAWATRYVARRLRVVARTPVRLGVMAVTMATLLPAGMRTFAELGRAREVGGSPNCIASVPTRPKGGLQNAA